MATEYLTMAEIEAKYPNEWVLVDRPTVNQLHEVTGGYLEWHHSDRSVFDRRLREHPLKDSAIFYSGVFHSEPLMAISAWTDDSIPD